jgi:hypothetical protein
MSRIKFFFATQGLGEKAVFQGSLNSLSAFLGEDHLVDTSMVYKSYGRYIPNLTKMDLRLRANFQDLKTAKAAW